MKYSRTAILLSIAFALFSLQLIATSFRQSKVHIYPLYDEVDFLNKGRAVRDQGGIPQTIKSYVQGDNRDDWHQPLYPFLLSFAMDKTNSPRDFSKAKLFSLMSTLVLLAILMGIGYRRKGSAGALICGTLVVLSPTTVHLSHMILVDALFAIFFVSYFAVINEANEEKSAWIGAGVLAGLAYLTKANGHILLLPTALTALFIFRGKVFKKPALYLAIGAFFLTAAFLFIRNVRVWGTLFHNVNNKILWLENWNQFLVVQNTPLWDRIGLSWYLAHHSLAQTAQRLWNGIQNMTVLLLEGLNILSFENRFRLFSGGIFLTFAVWGLVSVSKKRPRETIPYLLVFSTLFLAFSFFIEHATRYIYPLILSLIPYVGEGLINAHQWIQRKFKLPSFGVTSSHFAGGLLLIMSLVHHRSLFSEKPMNFYLVPETWDETTRWIEKNIPNERFVLDNFSHYSTWYCCPDHRQPFPLSVDDGLIKEFIARKQIRYALLESLFLSKDLYQSKYGPSDEFGPTSFLNWRRCFHDQKKPSRFLIYSESCP